MVDTVLLKPLPFRDPERLLVVWEKNPAQNGYKLFVAPVNFQAWKKESRSVEQMAAFQDVRVNLTGGPNGHIDPEELLTVRTSAAPMTLASALFREIHQLEPDQPVADVLPMEEVVDQAVANARFNTLLLAVLAGVAFVLAAAGIYGVACYDVTQRTNEIGIRRALGAEPKDVLKLGQGARLAVYGIVAGPLGAAALTHLMGAMLYGVNPADAWTFAAISILLAVVALAASYLPSRRAMALDPVTALLHE